MTLTLEETIEILQLAKENQMKKFNKEESGVSFNFEEHEDRFSFCISKEMVRDLLN